MSYEDIDEDIVEVWDDDIEDYEEMMFTRSSPDLSIFKGYSQGIDTSYIVSYTNEEGKRKYDHTQNAGCFGTFRYGASKYKNYEVHEMYCSLRYRDEVKKEMLKWFNWIFDPKESPWRAILPKEGLKYLTREDSDTPHVILPISSDTPIQQVVSLFINARIGADNPGQVKLWHRLVEAGWTKAEAFYVMHYLRLNLTRNTVETNRGVDYYALSTYGDVDLDAIVNGKPHLMSSRLKFGTDYQRLGEMWLKPGSKNYYKKPDFYKIIANDRKYDGLFPKYYEKYVGDYIESGLIPSFEDLVKMKDKIFAGGSKSV